MNQEKPFRDAINNNPSDTTLQLVFADWLEEQGDPRAEGWRVLTEAGRRPHNYKPDSVNEWDWYSKYGSPDNPRTITLPVSMWENMSTATSDLPHGYKSFFLAMNAAAITFSELPIDQKLEVYRELMGELC